MPANYHRTEIRFSSQTMAKLRAIKLALQAHEKRFISMNELVVRLVETVLPPDDKEGKKEG
jgi:hypothetical protein